MYLKLRIYLVTLKHTGIFQRFAYSLDLLNNIVVMTVNNYVADLYW